MSGTEDSILNTIPDFNSGSDSGGSSAPSTPSEGGSQTTEAGSTPQTSASPTSTPATGGTSNQADSRTQQPIQRRHDGLLEVPNPNNPNTRDLVDPISGKVVAQGGIERRVFEEGQRHQRENQTLRQQLQQLQQYTQSVGEVTREAQRLNVTPENQVVAIRVMSDFMRDPVHTLQYLIEEVKSKGYPIPFLEQGISPGMDLNAISKMIDNKLQPLTQQQKQAQEQQQVRANAQRTLDAFLEQNQEAHVNLDVIAEMLQAQPGISLETAYLKMMQWAVNNGLDYRQPLRQQIAAAQQQRMNPQPTQPVATQQPSRPTRPLPNGRSASAGVVQNSGGSTQYNENASWADIIRQSMQESGINLS